MDSELCDEIAPCLTASWLQESEQVQAIALTSVNIYSHRYTSFTKQSNQRRAHDINRKALGMIEMKSISTKSFNYFVE